MKINTGTIEGFTRDGVHRWRAIPYARPPVARTPSLPCWRVPQAKGLFAQAISESPASGMVRSPDAAAKFAAHFVGLLGARPQDGTAALMSARPADLVNALDRLVSRGMKTCPARSRPDPRSAPSICHWIPSRRCATARRIRFR